MIIELNKLKIHKIHREIYASNSADDLKQSILELGLLEQIVVNKDLVILSGFRRFTALKALGHTETDVIVRNIAVTDEPETLVSFNLQREKTASEIVKEIQTLKLAWSAKRGRKSSNVAKGAKVNTRAKISQVTNISTGNISKLEYINEKKPELLAQIDCGKYTINQVHNFVVKLEEKKSAPDSIENLPEVIANDYYQIINKSSDDLSDIADESVQTIFTSPTYWNLRDYSGKENELGKEATSDEYVQRMADHLHACYRVLKPEGSFFLNLGDSYEDKQLMSIPHKVQIELSKRNWILKQTIIWKKANSLPSSVHSLTSSFEFIFWLVKSNNYLHHDILTPLKGESKPRLCEVSRKGNDDSVADIARFCIAGLKSSKKLEDFWTPDIVYTATANQAAVKRHGGTNHPAPYPGEICIVPILLSSNPGDTVLDVFSGSGTTGEVALLCGRKYIGYELNPDHNRVQVDRLNKAIEKYNQAGIKQAA